MDAPSNDSAQRPQYHADSSSTAQSGQHARPHSMQPRASKVFGITAPQTQVRVMAPSKGRPDSGGRPLVALIGGDHPHDDRIREHSRVGEPDPAEPHGGGAIHRALHGAPD